MPTDVITKKAKKIPTRYMDQLLEYMDFLLYKSAHDDDGDDLPVKRVLGQFKGRIKMADDFDETPDCFKEYM